jgi:uncharacterized protein YceH (UPF0502 family)
MDISESSFADRPKVNEGEVPPSEGASEGTPGVVAAGGIVLSAMAARVLGSLIEKEFATPDVYPLTLNSLVNACNQKSNRDPVISVSGREVELGLEELKRHRLAILVAGSDARVPKYKQKLDLVFPVDEEERALMCELLLRGPQTAAGLRANAERLHAMPSVERVEEILQELAGGGKKALVRRLPRQTGQKEARWAQLLSGEPEAGWVSEPEALTVEVTLPPEVARRFEALELEVRELREQLRALRSELGVAEG